MDPKFKEYAHPEMLVDGEWLQAHLADPGVRVVESNEDPRLYEIGHIPGSVHIDWRCDLQDNTVRDYVTPESFAAVCSRNGIAPGTTAVFYSDKSNWWAAYALWAFRLFGHGKVKLLDGGRAKWHSEGRAMTRTVPAYRRVAYPVRPRRRDKEIRAFYDETLLQMKAGKPLIDVRSPGEFRGEITHMPGYPQEGVLRGGHIPGARSVPWNLAANYDGTFKTHAELSKIYTENLGLKPAADIITYCRIGERSSHTWFVLTCLLGYRKVRNYDGSWTEWGNRVRTPIEKGG